MTNAFDCRDPAPAARLPCTNPRRRLRLLALGARSSPLVAKFLDFLATDANYSRAWRAPRTSPRTWGVAKAGVTYKRLAGRQAALNSFVADVAKIAKPNYQLQGLSLQPCDLPGQQRSVSVRPVVGEMSADDAIKQDAG